MAVAFKNQLAMLSWQANLSSLGVWSDELGTRLPPAMLSDVWTEEQRLDKMTVPFAASQEIPQLLMVLQLCLSSKHPVCPST